MEKTEIRYLRLREEDKFTPSGVTAQEKGSFGRKTNLCVNSVRMCHHLFTCKIVRRFCANRDALFCEAGKVEYL